jgi:hypothetical protein
LASIVYAVLIAEADVPGGEIVFTVAAWTILLRLDAYVGRRACRAAATALEVG